MPFPVDIAFVRRTEQRLGVRFPPEYVVRMTRENGGELETVVDSFELHPFLDDGDRKRLKRTCNDIVRETQTLRELEWFPSIAVAIGTNGAGDNLILLPREDDAAILNTTLYVWTLASDGTPEPIGDTSELFDV